MPHNSRESIKSTVSNAFQHTERSRMSCFSLFTQENHSIEALKILLQFWEPLYRTRLKCIPKWTTFLEHHIIRCLWKWIDLRRWVSWGAYSSSANQILPATCNLQVLESPRFTYVLLCKRSQGLTYKSPSLLQNPVRCRGSTVCCRPTHQLIIQHETVHWGIEFLQNWGDTVVREDKIVLKPDRYYKQTDFNVSDVFQTIISLLTKWQTTTQDDTNVGRCIIVTQWATIRLEGNDEISHSVHKTNDLQKWKWNLQGSQQYKTTPQPPLSEEIHILIEVAD